MNCLRPVSAYDLGLNTATGKRRITFKRPPLATVNEFFVPCGKCEVCRQTKRNSWIRRCNLELLLNNGVGTFLTLTYRPSDCPSDLCKRDLQLFFKRLRNVGRDFGVDLPKIRYFAVGEYGKLHSRPHYHAIIFGLNLLASSFAPYLATVKDGYPIFSSRVLETVWRKGFVTIDEVTSANIRYVSKYVSKSDDGFVIYSEGIGRGLFVDVKRHGRNSQMVPHSFLRSSAASDKVCYEYGKAPSTFPKFALRYVERFYPDVYEELKRKRKEYVDLHPLRSWFDPSVAAHDINQQTRMDNLKKVLHQ